jgi:hypothetical protein
MRCVWCAKKGATEPVGTQGQRIHLECIEPMSNARVKPIMHKPWEPEP